MDTDEFFACFTVVFIVHFLSPLPFQPVVENVDNISEEHMELNTISQDFEKTIEYEVNECKFLVLQEAFQGLRKKLKHSSSFQFDFLKFHFTPIKVRQCRRL